MTVFQFLLKTLNCLIWIPLCCNSDLLATTKSRENQGYKVRRDTLKLISLIHGSNKPNIEVSGWLYQTKLHITQQNYQSIPPYFMAFDRILQFQCKWNFLKKIKWSNNGKDTILTIEDDTYWTMLDAQLRKWILTQLIYSTMGFYLATDYGQWILSMFQALLPWPMLTGSDMTQSFLRDFVARPWRNGQSRNTFHPDMVIWPHDNYPASVMHPVRL